MLGKGKKAGSGKDVSLRDVRDFGGYENGGEGEWA